MKHYQTILFERQTVKQRLLSAAFPALDPRLSPRFTSMKPNTAGEQNERTGTNTSVYMWFPFQRTECPDNNILTVEYPCVRAGGKNSTCFRWDFHPFTNLQPRFPPTPLWPNEPDPLSETTASRCVNVSVPSFPEQRFAHDALTWQAAAEACREKRSCNFLGLWNSFPRPLNHLAVSLSGLREAFWKLYTATMGGGKTSFPQDHHSGNEEPVGKSVVICQTATSRPSRRQVYYFLRCDTLRYVVRYRPAEVNNPMKMGVESYNV